jgi:hypothetical protein
MKKYIIPVFATLALLASCTAKFDEMNTDSTALTASSVQAHMVFGRCMYHGMSNDHQRNFNLNDDMYAHYFAEGLGWTDYWRYNEGWGNIYWRDFYTERLPEYHLINKIIGDDPDYNGMKAANDIWNVILWLRVIDRYGDAPYMDDEGNYAGQGVTMPYTPISKIYPDLVARLQNDVNLLGNPGSKTFGAYDLMYANDWSKWKKLANTLIMRLAMRMCNTAEGASLKNAFSTAAGGAMSAASDYARVCCDTYVWGDYYDRTYYDWANTFTSADFMDMMNGNNKGYATGIVDPRRDFWFKEGTGATSGSGWDGFPNGNYAIDTRADVKQAHGGSSSFAGLNVDSPDGFFYFNFHKTRKENLSWCLASYSETCFLKAEAALRGWISGDAEALWKEGIKASMDEVAFMIQMSGGTKTISGADKNAYIAALPSFGTDNESKLRSIMIQKWIALFPNSAEAWCDQRRTGYPDYASGVFTYPTIHPSSLVTDGNIVQRIPYPDNEYNTNKAMMPSKYQNGDRDQQSNLYWALGGEGKTQSKSTLPKNL